MASRARIADCQGDVKGRRSPSRLFLWGIQQSGGGSGGVPGRDSEGAFFSATAGGAEGHTERWGQCPRRQYGQAAAPGGV